MKDNGDGLERLAVVEVVRNNQILDIFEAKRIFYLGMEGERNNKIKDSVSCSQRKGGWT